MRIMAASLTTQQCYDFLKTVTRRDGWRNIKPGEIIQLVEKGQGLKKDEHVKKIHEIQIISARWERLDTILSMPEYGALEMIREGFPGKPAHEFIEMYCKHNKKRPEDLVNRIEFRYYLSQKKYETLRVPANVAACPACAKPLTISPDGWSELEDGTWSCDSFTFWCDSQPDIDERKEYEAFEESHKYTFDMSYVYWLPVQNNIEEWLLDTFRFDMS